MICINTSLGLHTPNLFPEQAGKGYVLTPYLEAIQEFRDEFTIFSGLSHPEMDGGHSTELCYLTGALHPRSDSFKNSISLDQFAIEKLVPDTRFASLTLSSSSSRGLSFTRGGVPIPPDDRPSRVFKSMFVDGTANEVKAQVQRLKQGQSIMDTVQDEAKAFQRGLGKTDQDKLDEYFTSVREVENQLAVQLEKPAPNQACKVITEPKPVVGVRNDCHSRETDTSATLSSEDATYGRSLT